MFDDPLGRGALALHRLPTCRVGHAHAACTEVRTRLEERGLRKAATGRVPHSVTARPTKLGFPVSIGARALADLRTLCADLVASRAFVERGIYHVGNAQKLLATTAQGATPNQADALFHLAQTEVWLGGLGPQAARVPS